MDDQLASELRIAAMELDDVDQVMVVELRNYEYPWTPGNMRDCIVAGYECTKLLLNDQLIGYYVVQHAADEAQLLNICIDKSQQAKGFALQLLTVAMRRAVELGANEMFLEVRPSNRRAITLYEGLGFNEIACRPDYYDAKQGREDAIVMALNLQVQDNG